MEATSAGYSAGIGGGFSDGSDVAVGGQITITGGSVTASSSGGGVGIGGGYGAASGSFSTGGGNAFIVASSIQDTTNQNSWSGVIFEGDNSGKVYGSPVTLTADVNIPADKTLEIETGEILVIGKDTTLHNSGAIVNDGFLVNCGVLDNDVGVPTNNGIFVTGVSGEVEVTGGGELLLPGGTTVTKGETTVTIGDETTGTVDQTGGVTLPDGGSVTVTDNTTTTTVAPPAGGGKVAITGGGVSVPAGGTVKTGGTGPLITLPEGGIAVVGGSVTTVTDGTVRVGDTTIRPAVGGTVVTDKGGSTTVPAGATVEKDGVTVVIGANTTGTVDKTGGVTLPDGGSITVTHGTTTTTVTPPAGGGKVEITSDGKVTVPGGSVIEKDGTTVTVPEGGGTMDPSTGAMYRTVTFDSQGGSAIANATVTDGEKAEKPADPTRSGYTFGGWYKESSCTTAWDFDADTVTANVTLYAKWTPSSSNDDYTPSTRPSAKVDGVGGTVRTGSGTVTITPDEGYQIGKITVNGKEVDIPENGKLTGLKRTDKVVVTFEMIPDEPEPPTVDMSKYTDLDAGAWYFEAVRYVVEHGLFAGTSDTTFSPNATMTRAMLMTVLARAKGQDTTAPSGGMWYDVGMTWAVEHGISDGTNPDSYLTREQLAVMLYRYAGSPAAPNLILDFTDTGKISNYAQDAVRWAVEQGIISGKGNGVLDPKGEATRAEVAAMLMRYLLN